MVRITGNAEVRPVNVNQSLRQKGGESGKTSISTFLFTIILHKGLSSLLNAYYLGGLTLVIPVFFMKHYYLYISCGTSLDDDARFYKVAIGTSARESRFHAFLESYAIEHGHLFVLWDGDAIGFLNRCLESVNKTLSQVTTCTGKDLCNYFKGITGKPYSLSANMQRHDLLRRIDAAYYATYMLRRKK